MAVSIRLRREGALNRPYYKVVVTDKRSPRDGKFLEFVVRQLVEFPDEAIITEIPSGRTTVFRLQLRQSDVGRIIGRNGQTIQSIRALLSSAASRHNQRATLEIVE